MKKIYVNPQWQGGAELSTYAGAEEIKEYLGICREVGLAAIVETHDEEEVETAVRAGADIIGVNNRDLKDFSVNGNNSRRLGSLIPEGCLFVSESGIMTPGDVAAAAAAGADAVLIGEAVMRADDIGAEFDRLRSLL